MMANPLDQFDTIPSEKSAPSAASANPLDQFDKEQEIKFATSPDTEKRKYKWSEVPSEALKHAPESGVAAAKGLVEPILHPIQTYETGKQLVGGLASKAAGALGMPQDPEAKAANEATVNAIRDFYKDRFGSEEGFKRALAEDPVGVMADFSTVLGGGSIAARAPGLLGKAGELSSAASRAINPINVAGRVASPVISGAQKLASYPLSIKTGVPSATIRTAYKAGEEGSAPFLEQMRGTKEPSEIVDAAHDATAALRDKRRTDYLASKVGWSASQTPIDYKTINQALLDAEKDVMHGTRVYRPEAKKMLDDLRTQIEGWQQAQNTPGVNYHNIEGVDKLKQLVGDIRSGAVPGSPAEALGTKIYNSIKNTLVSHDPNYQTAMGQYSDASDMLKQLKSTLSINPKASVDTTLRKLLLAQKQVDGNKASLLSELQEVNPELGNMIAGHLMSQAIPVGFSGKIGAALSMAPHAAGAIDPVTAAINAAASSPRVVGELSYGAGKLSRGRAPTTALVPGEIAKAAPAEQATVEPEEHPFFEKRRGGSARRASGGRILRGMNANALISAVERAQKIEQQNTKSILNHSDEHVAGALKIAKANLQG